MSSSPFHIRFHNKKTALPLQLAAAFLAVLIAAVGCLTLVYCLPVQPMQRNLSNSADIFAAEGLYPTPILGGAYSKLDNFTDALMFNTAACPNEGSAIEAAMRATRWNNGKEPVSTLLDLQDPALSSSVSVSSYPRYWHGYLIFLKPLLLFLNYYQIRRLILFVQIFLVIVIVSLLGAKKESVFILPFALFWMHLNPVALGVSLQFNTIFLLTCLTLLILILFRERLSAHKNAFSVFFFVLGCLTSFFDLLTYPVVTLGIPLIYLLSAQRQGPKDSLLMLGRLGFLWALGYSLMWSSKWVISSLITHENVIMNAVEAITHRTSRSSEDGGFTYWGVVDNNYWTLPTILRFSTLLAGIAALYGLIKDRKGFLSSAPILAVALFPYLWYFILSNHSYTHSFFTYRELSVTVFSLSVFACEILLPSRLRRSTDERL